ncbi:MAG: DUF4302 domain-containing protein [Prevotellaceae bacterium]|jgi:hypothetical protein|nr:DUF4302 domain-containing protein [Prevotellaceae bacterium]
MKNKLFIGLLLSLFALQACVKDEDKVFDNSAADRMNAAITSYRSILVSEANGWLVEYFPENDLSMGGYYFIWKFNNDGTVEMAGEVPTAKYAAGQTSVSTYAVIAEEGPVLTFNTYNEVFHLFVEPFGASDVDGYAGDYEFVIREVTPEQIVMTGKKYGNKIRLTPYTDTKTWKDHLTQFVVLDQKMAALGYNVKVNGTNVRKAVRRYRTFSFENNAIAPYIITTTGIKLYKPLTIYGKTAQYFTFNEAEKKLVSDEADSDIVIELGSPPVNGIFAATNDSWKIEDNECSNSFRTLLTTTKNQLLNGGYNFTYNYMYCGRSPLDNNMVFAFFVFQSAPGNAYYHVIYNFIYTPAPGTDDQIKFAYIGPGNGNAANQPAPVTGILATITNKSPYSITIKEANSPIIPAYPQGIQLTSVADPNFYFVIYSTE